MVFTNEEIIAAIDMVVAGREDFVYDLEAAALCNYSYTDCFVGRVCGGLDPQIQKDLIEWEKCGDSPFEAIEITQGSDHYQALASRISKRFTRQQIMILNDGQRHQDTGSRWGAVAQQVKEDLSK